MHRGSRRLNIVVRGSAKFVCLLKRYAQSCGKCENITIW